jgi:O-antigen ligase
VSRFNNIKAVFGPPGKTVASVERPPAPRGPTPGVKDAGEKPGPGARAQARPAASPILRQNPADTTLGQKVGFLVLCIYLVSGYANEFAIRALGAKAYISTVALPVLPILLLISGNLFRGLRDTIGRLWLGLIAWMCLSTPFSLWKGGSAELLRDYVTHSWIFFFLITGFAVTLKHCRWMMGVLIAANFLLLVDCAVASHISDGRLHIPDSAFFANANDLSLQLVLAITQFFYLLFQPGVWGRVLAVVGISTALVYSLQTGSRGVAIAILVLAAVIFAVGSQKLLWAAVVLVAGMAAIVIVPSGMLHRISLLTGDEPVLDNSDLAAEGSRMQRLELLRQSVEFTIENPLLGVGPGQFAVAVNGEAEKEGKRAPWLGTHNSYTEVSSECGLPGFFIYTGVVILCLWSNLRMFRRSARQPQLRQLNALAFSAFCGCVVYAVATFFFHIAYSSYLPQLAGMTVALRLSVDPSFWRSRRVVMLAGTSQGFPGQLSKGAA